MAAAGRSPTPPASGANSLALGKHPKVDQATPATSKGKVTSKSKTEALQKLASGSGGPPQLPEAPRQHSPQVERALHGDGYNLGARRQRKWAALLLRLQILREVPGSHPRQFELGQRIHKLWEYLPFRRDLAEGVKQLDEDDNIVDGPRAEKRARAVEEKSGPPPSSTVTSGDLERESELARAELQQPKKPAASGGGTPGNGGDLPPVVSVDEDERREELWVSDTRTNKEEVELQRLLVSYRTKLRRMRVLNSRQREDLAWIEARPPETRMAELRVEADWERALLQGGAFRRSANGTIGPGPYHHLIEDYEANQKDILERRMRISTTTGKVVPPIVEDGAVGGEERAPEPKTSRREKEERKTWLYNLPLGGQRARIAAIRRLRDADFPLTEEQHVDLEYLRDLLQ